MSDKDGWKALAEKELRGRTPTSLTWTTPEGIAVAPVYTAEDADDLPHMGSMPGEAPFTRGPRATMYAGRPWTIRQYAGFSTAEESNAFYRKALAAGQQGVSVAFDLATHRGYDSDHARVEGDVGKAGVAIDSVEDMKILFDGIPLGEVSVSMTMNGAVIPVLASLHRRRRRAGRRPRRAVAARSRTTSSRSSWSATPISIRPNPRCGSLSDIIEYTSDDMPKFNSISISGYHMQEAGANLVQELAFTLADGKEYVKAAVDARHGRRRLRRAAVVLLRHRHEFLHGGRQAARRAVPVAPHHDRVSTPKKPGSLMLRTHCQTSGVSLAGTGPLQQHRAHRLRGDERGSGRHPVAAHQQL